MRMNVTDYVIGSALAISTLLGSVSAVLRCWRREREQGPLDVSSAPSGSDSDVADVADATSSPAQPEQPVPANSQAAQIGKPMNCMCCRAAGRP